MPAETNYLSLSEAAAKLPGTRGAPRSRTCMYRWCTEGVRAADGERIVLPSRRIGGFLFVAENSLDDFLSRLNGEACCHA